MKEGVGGGSKGAGEGSREQQEGDKGAGGGIKEQQEGDKGAEGDHHFSSNRPTGPIRSSSRDVRLMFV